MKVIKIFGYIGYEVTLEYVKTELDEANGAPVRVEINSPGGKVNIGVAIFNLLNNYEGEVTTVNIGLAASMASVIFLAGDDGKRLAYSNSMYMIHNALAGIYGNHNDLRQFADHLERVTNLLVAEYCKITKKSKEEIKELLDQDTYFYGSEVKDEGFADVILEGQSDSSKEEAITKAELEVEACCEKVKGTIFEDYKQAVALLPQKENKESTQKDIQAKSSSTNINGGKRMTVKDIKDKYPSAYKDIFKAGVKAENGRVCNLLNWNQSDKQKEVALNAIKSGKSQNDVLADLTNAAVNNQVAKTKKDLTNNSEGDIEDAQEEDLTDSEDNIISDEDIEAVLADLEGDFND